MVLDLRTYDFRIPDSANPEEKYVFFNAVQTLLKNKSPKYKVIPLRNIRLINIKLKISFEALR